MSLCSDLITRARWTWKHMKKAHSVGIRPSEETITEMNLTELQVKHPQQIKTQTFSKRKELKTGADWDWELWLGSQNLWLSLSIQAKKLNPQNLRYEDLDYQPKNSPKKTNRNTHKPLSK